MAQRTLTTPHGKASKIGQWIGEAFEKVVIGLITAHLNLRHPGYEILNPAEGRRLLTLEMRGGSRRQLDTILAPKGSRTPVALLETKWLKDARHWNDKGAWILQLREIKMNYATVRGAVAVLAGYWKEGVGVMLKSEGGVKMVLVATDEEVYSTLQKPLDEYLGERTFNLDAEVMRKKYPRLDDLYNFMLHLYEKDALQQIAETWLEFERETDENGQSVKGKDLVRQAIDELLAPLPPEPRITSFEISLQIETGNIIHEKFSDLEELFDFVNRHAHDPAEILKRIAPE